MQREEHNVKRPLTQETTTLKRINYVISTTLNVGEVLKRIITEVVQLLAARSASVILHDDITHEAELTTTYGTGAAVHTLRYPLQGSLTGWVAEHQRPLRVSRLNQEEWPIVWRLAEQLGATPSPVAVLLAPLWVQEQIVGSLEVVWEEGHRITDRDEQLLAAIAVQAAIGITNARLYQEKERALRAVQESEQRLKAQYQGSPIPTYIWRRRGEELVFAEYNEAANTMSHGRIAEWVETTAADFYRDAPDIQAMLTRCLTEQIVLKEERSYQLRTTGECKQFALNYVFVPPDLVMVHAEDITKRKQTEEALEEEMQIATALARVGRALISSLDAPVLLQRLCQITAEILGANNSHTLLWRPEEGMFVPVSGFGDTPEQSEYTRLLKIPRVWIAGVIAQLEWDDVVEVCMEDPRGMVRPEVARLSRLYGGTVGLYMGLRRGEELIGLQTAFYQGSTSSFTPWQKRIARGIAQLASMAFNNARLLEEAQSAHRLKTAFLHTLSHELRTPFNVILGYVELLLEGEFGPLNAEQTDTMEQVKQSAQGLFELVAALLEASQLETQRLPVEMTEVDGNMLLAELRQETERMRTDLNWDWRIAPALPRLYTDRTKLKVILKNLLDNAVKFTPQGTVTMTMHSQKGGVEFCVSDTGIGMAPEALSVVFEPFRQGDGSPTRRYHGVGLGLYIVRRLVDVLGGTVTVESAVDHGSTFRVWLPASNKEAVQWTTPFS